MSTPGYADFQHVAGDTLNQGFRINTRASMTAPYLPADLTGCTAIATVRNARTKVAMPGVSAVISNQAIDPGIITIAASSATTATWTKGPSLEYDLQITETATGNVRTILTGKIIVVEQVTP